MTRHNPSAPTPPPRTDVRPALRGRLALSFPWLLLLLVAGWIVIDRYRTREVVTIAEAAPAEASPATGTPPADGATPGVAIDPVCGMTVATRNSRGVVAGADRQYFCSEFCMQEYLADRDAFAARTAPPEVHTMRGIPGWYYGLGVAVVLAVSFGLFEALSWWDRRRGPRGPAAMDARWHVTAPSIFRRILRIPWLQFAVQAVMVVLFLLIIAAGLFGNQNAGMNIAPMLTWTIWWVGLIFVVLYFGKAWCYVCPWDAIATWIERLKFWGPRRDGIGLQAKWPAVFRNIWLAVGFFVLLTWIELGLGITMIPRATAYVALGMLGMTIVGMLIFERKAFCRYACLVGRVSGLYALFGSTELRALDDDACATCRTFDCYKGNEHGDGCPTFEFTRTLRHNTYCILCAECIKTCPKDNVGVRLRPWAADLAREGRPRTDEAFLAVILLAMTGLHGLTMTPKWTEWNASLQAAWGIPSALSFGFLMTVLIAGPFVIFAALAHLSAYLARRGDASEEATGSKRVFVHYAYALLPIALFYHLAHNAEHFLMEGPKVIALASDPFGWGWNIFGTARWTMAPLISLEGLWIIQVLFVLVGHLYGLWIAERVTRRLVSSRRVGIVSQLPMLAAMILFSLFSLWLLKQPMEMRISAM